MKILIMGLPGSGKSTYAQDLLDLLPPTLVNYINADEVRAHANDWDFTDEGRLRQAHRMAAACQPGRINIIDMVAALPEQRTSPKDPYRSTDVENNIKKDLDKYHRLCYNIIHIPNITGVYYGRDVGYEVERIHLPKEIKTISATEIRRKNEREPNQ